MQKLQSLIRHFKSLNQKKCNPILITDIDGVLVRGSNPIPTTLQALHKISEHKIPFACLTNGGGQLQSTKSKKLRQIFNIPLTQIHQKQQNKLHHIFRHDNMFMNHTPLKPQIVKYSRQSELILVTGSLQIQQILHDLGVNNYITCDEFYTLYHQKEDQNKDHLIWNGQKYPSFKGRDGMYQKVKSNVEARLKRKLPNLDQIEQTNKMICGIGAIFAMNDVSPYQTALQVIHHVLAHKKSQNELIPPYFAAQNDIIWAGGYIRPRMAFGPFNYMLKDHCQMYGFDLKQIHFGKPQLVAFKFVEKIMRERHCGRRQRDSQKDLIKGHYKYEEEQACFFMVGDNPRADIRGANRAGWASFLTQTGIHHGPQNDKDNPATVVVEDFREAVNLIIQLKSVLNSSTNKI